MFAQEGALSFSLLWATKSLRVSQTSPLPLPLPPKKKELPLKDPQPHHAQAEAQIRAPDFLQRIQCTQSLRFLIPFSTRAHKYSLLGTWTLTLVLQKAQSRSYVSSVGLKVGIIYVLGPLVCRDP